MLFEDNPVFIGFYTDSMEIYRNVDKSDGNVGKSKRERIGGVIPCRVYSAKRGGPRMGNAAATTSSVDKVSCDLSVDIKAGDELHITRGGMLGMNNEPERYFADRPHPYFDPVGGALSGLEHQEIALLTDEII